MSTTYKGLAVSFKKYISEERAAAIRTAFQLLDGVAEVKLVETEISLDYFVESRLRLDLWNKIADVVWPERKER